jgi:hypothetical protein
MVQLLSRSNLKLEAQEVILVGKFCKFTGPKDNKLCVTCDIQYQSVLIANGRLSQIKSSENMDSLAPFYVQISFQIFICIISHVQSLDSYFHPMFSNDLLVSIQKKRAVEKPPKKCRPDRRSNKWHSPEDVEN